MDRQNKPLLPGLDPASTAEPSEALLWLRAYAEHVRMRFNSRALVTARVNGEPAVPLSQVYALEGGGLVLALCDDPEHGHEGHEHHDHPADAHAHDAGAGEEACDPEIWVDSPGQVVFEARSVEDGVLCTGFGYLGYSRTPLVIIPRGTEPPPKRDHHGHDF